MKTVFSMLLLGVVGIGAQTYEDINKVEGLYYEYNEFDNIHAFMTNPFYLTDSCPYIAKWELVALLVKPENRDVVLKGKNATFGLYLYVTGLSYEYEKRMVLLLDDKRIEIADSNFKTYAYLKMGVGLLTDDNLFWGKSIKTHIGTIKDAQTRKFQLEGCQGEFSDSCLYYLRLLYNACILNHWEEMIPSEETQIDEEIQN